MHGRALAAVLVWAGCYDPSVKLGVPCSDTGDCPRGQECDQVTNTCLGPTEIVAWREDTAADFMQGTVFDNAVVEEPGVVAPTPYITGRAVWSAIAADTIGDVATATWATASAGTITGHAFTSNLAIDYDTDVPWGLGLTVGDNVTVLVEGELYLDTAGMWRFLLTANDQGFVDIAAPGGEFQRLVSDVDTGTSVDYTVVQPGWYRIRGAFSDVNVAMSFSFRVDSPAVTGGFREVNSDDLRAPIAGLTGYATDAFDRGGLLQYVASTNDASPLDRQIAADMYGIPVGSSGWSFRWSGQMLIETEGDYAFQLVSFHGHRMWIDGMQVVNNFSTSATATSTSSPLHLEPGWHDLAIDVTKDSDPTTGEMRFTVASGPQWAGQPIPSDHIRPVTGRATRWITTSNTTTLAIPDGGSATRTVSLPGTPAAFTPTQIEAGFELTHAARTQVSVVLDPPVGSNITLVASGALGGSGGYSNHRNVPVGDFGTAWGFIVSDNVVDAVTGSLQLATVTAVGSGGTPPFPPSFHYESAVHELGNVVGLGPVTWQLRQGSTATVQLRTCDDAAACAGEPWTDVTSGEVPAVAPRRFAQYAVTVPNGGDVPTAFDWFELTYSARPE